jgi:hypothetical protein
MSIIAKDAAIAAASSGSSPLSSIAPIISYFLFLSA